MSEQEEQKPAEDQQQEEQQQEEQSISKSEFERLVALNRKLTEERDTFKVARDRRAERERSC